MNKVYKRTEDDSMRIVSVSEALAEVNAAMMGRLSRERSVRTMSSARGDHSITYADGRQVRLVQIDPSAYEIEINARVVSYWAESCPEEGTEDHMCIDDCTWLDGDSRELEPRDTETHEPDADDLDEHDGDLIAWAVAKLRPMHSFEASTEPVPDAMGEHCWLSATDDDIYAGPGRRTTETSVYLRGDWTPEQRADVFRAVTE